MQSGFSREPKSALLREVGMFPSNDESPPRSFFCHSGFRLQVFQSHRPRLARGMTSPEPRNRTPRHSHRTRIVIQKRAPDAHGMNALRLRLSRGTFRRLHDAAPTGLAYNTHPQQRRTPFLPLLRGTKDTPMTGDTPLMLSWGKKGVLSRGWFQCCSPLAPLKLN